MPDAASWPATKAPECSDICRGDPSSNCANVEGGRFGSAEPAFDSTMLSGLPLAGLEQATSDVPLDCSGRMLLEEMSGIDILMKKLHTKIYQ